MCNARYANHEGNARLRYARHACAMQGYGACATHACAMQGTHVTCEMQGYITTCLLASTCWLPSPAYWLLPVGFHIYLACLFSLSPAGCLSPAGIRLPPVDLRLLASCSRLLAVACWLPPPAGSLSHAGCRLLASIFHLLAFTFCFLFDSSDFTGGPVTRTSTHDTDLVGLLTNRKLTNS